MWMEFWRRHVSLMRVGAVAPALRSPPEYFWPKETSYAQKLVTGKLGGVLKLLDPVLELNPLNDFGQSIGAAELSPFLLG